jgi:3'-5' exoribonuclease
MNMERKKIIELELGEEIEGFFLIKEILYKTASNSKNYLDMRLSDGTGEINAKLWECSEKEASLYQLFQLVKVRAQVTEWQGKKQLRITRMRRAQESDGLNIEDFVPTAPLKPQKMFELVEAYIEKIANKDIKMIVQVIMEENKEKILYYPAAKTNHHAIRSGLLYHIVRMLELAEKLSEIYPFVNRDLLFAGVILHDIAKIDEMDANPLGMVKDYTAEGQLLGHIVQGIKRVAQVGEQVGADEEISILLQHMILSHHYEPEFGSPKKPMIPEAELLHYIDIIDARMYDMENALMKIEPKQFTERIWVLERKLYKAAFDSDDEAASAMDETGKEKQIR